MKNIDFPSSDYNYYTKLANAYRNERNYDKACYATIKALKLVKGDDERKQLLYNLAFFLDKEGNDQFIDEALFRIIDDGELKRKAILMLFINAYHQNDFDKMEHNFRLLQQCVIEMLMTHATPDIVSAKDEMIDVNVLLNISFDDKNIFPIEYYVDTDSVAGLNFSEDFELTLTNADDRAKNDLTSAMKAFDDEEYDLAIDYIDNNIKNKYLSDQMRGELYNAKAYIYYQLNKVKKSFDCLQKASYYNVKDVKTLSLYLSFADYSQNEALRDETLENLVNIETRNIADIKIVCDTLCRAKYYDAAIKYIDKQLENRPSQYELNKVKGIIFVKMKEFTKAREIFKKLYDKYTDATDIKFYIYCLDNFKNDEIDMDMISESISDRLKAHFLYMVKDDIKSLDFSKKKNRTKIEFAFDYLLRLKYFFGIVDDALIQYILVNNNREYIDYIIKHANRYNPQYLDRLVQAYTMRHINEMFCYTGGGVFTKNPIISILGKDGKEYPIDLQSSLLYVFGRAINNPDTDKRMVMNKLLRTLAVFMKVNNKALKDVNIVSSSEFRMLFYIVAFSEEDTLMENIADAIEENNKIDSLCKKFDIINYIKNLNALGDEFYDNFR